MQGATWAFMLEVVSGKNADLVKSFSKTAKDVGNTLKMSMASTLGMPDLAPAGVTKIEVSQADFVRLKAPLGAVRLGESCQVRLGQAMRVVTPIRCLVGWLCSI